MVVFWIEEHREHLTVTDIGGSDSISAVESMVNIDANAVLVTIRFMPFF
jgi:hypothetical protein